MGFLNWIMKGVDTEETNTNIDFIDASELDNQTGYDMQQQQTMINQDDRLENLRNLANMEKQNSVVVAPMQTQQPVYIPQAQRFEEPPKVQKQQIVVFKIASIRDIQSAIKHLNKVQPCVVDFDKITKRQQAKLMDYLSGAIFALDATIHRMQGRLYLISPNGIEIALQDKIKGKKR